jgi:hypothetical protein
MRNRREAAKTRHIFTSLWKGPLGRSDDGAHHFFFFMSSRPQRDDVILISK